MKLFLITAIAAALSGCKVDIDRNVLFVGDSQLAMNIERISHVLLTDSARGYFLMNNAIGGTTFAHGDVGAAYALTRAPLILARHQVDDVVISLGTNDVALNANPVQRVAFAEMVSGAGQLMDAYAGRRVLWLLPPECASLVHGAALYDEVVAAIETAAASRPHVELVDFRAMGMPAAEACRSGDVHLSPQGAKLWAAMIQGALAQD